MRTAIIRSTWMGGYGYRLDCQPYLGGALEAKVLLERLPLRKDKLHTLTAGVDGGIYNGPQFVRRYVDSLDYGIPFMTGSSLRLADTSQLPLISRRDALGPKLRHLEIEPGMSLISCSGTIGTMAYARRDMKGVWSSQDVLKVVASPDKIRSGYLYAYLCSKFGIPLVASGTYGAIIQHLEPEHIADLPVPRLTDSAEAAIHNLVEAAAELRSQAAAEIHSTTEALREFLGLPRLRQVNVRGFGISTVSSKELNWRLDPTYHSIAADEADRALRRCRVPVRLLADRDVTARLFKPPMFKRLWVTDPSEGVQFVSGNDAYNFSADDVRYVSFITPHFDDFLVREGWLVFQAAGQIYGLFARPLFISGWLDGLFVADDMYRVVPNEPTDGAYLVAFFRTDVGQVLIKRQSAGKSIPRVWDPQMTQLSVPWPGAEDRHHFGRQIISAHEKLFGALQAEQESVAMVEREIAKVG